ncbi:MAG TPA: aldo/keto reductase [Terriglobia bacterium]|nr:aldo/keto reductase [Terriglobia bacterium]
MSATPQGTRRYAKRFANLVAAEHFREAQGLTLSSIGIGTYLGEPDSATDDAYRSAIVRAVGLGVNVIDSAINYRFQRSERSVGMALRDLLASGTARRDELVIATKAGFLTFDGEVPEDPRHYIQDTLICTGIIDPCDITAGSHCMTPKYLEHQLHRSLQNLGVDAIDIFYIHNPETQLSDIDRDEFVRRLRSAFEYLEGAVRDGKIRHYGLATWNAFRVPQDARDSVSIEAAVLCAHSIAADAHHLRFVQLPYNLAMPEAFAHPTQVVDGQPMTILQACRQLGISVMASASMFQNKLSQGLPPVISEHLKGLRTDAQRAIQFVRSTPGIAAGLVGMSRIAHVEEDLEVARIPPDPEAVAKLFE